MKSGLYICFMKVKDLIIQYLQFGYTQAEIADIFKQQGIEPNSLSSIEKILKAIRKEHNAKTMFHLGYILVEKKLSNVAQ